jgi:uncharacterized membrane protein
MSTDARPPSTPPTRAPQPEFTQAVAPGQAGRAGAPGARRRRGGSGGPATRASGSPHRAWVGAMTVAAAVIYAGFGLVQQATFRTTTYDLVIFDQAVRSYAHLQPGIAIVKGIHNGGGPHFSILGDHWSPIIAVAAPLYWLYDGPQTLLVLQGVAFAAAIPFVWLFTRRIAADRVRAGAAATAAYFTAAAYALSWPIAEAAAFGFHEVAFVPVATAAFFERAQAGRPRAAMAAAGALLLVKEDMGLLVAGLGLWLVAGRRAGTARPRRRPLGAAMIAAGMCAAAVSTLVLRPAFGGSAMYYWHYSALGRDAGQAGWRLITHPLAGAHLLATPLVKLETLAWLGGALAFLPLLSPISLAAIPLLAERMLADSAPGWWGRPYQYNAFIVVVLVCAAADGALRLSGWIPPASPASRARALAAVTALCGAAAIALVPFFPLGAALRPSFYRLTARDRAAAAAVAAVPSGVTVEAANDIGPQLTSRDTVLLWDWAPRWAPWVVADTGRALLGFPGRAAQAGRVSLLLHNGYRVVLARDGYVVLHKERG